MEVMHTKQRQTQNSHPQWDLNDRYSNLFLNAYINRHAHTEYLKMIEFYSPLGIWHVLQYSTNTNTYHFRSMKYRQYVLIPPNQRIHLQVCTADQHTAP